MNDVIEVIDEIPASGKTTEAREIMLKHALENRSGLIVYAAPTLALLSEVESKLESALDIKDEVSKMIVLNNDFNSVTTMFAYLLGMTTLGNLKKKVERWKEVVEAKAEAKLILCTHECIIQAPRVDTTTCRETTLIFDEARNCVLGDAESKVSIETSQQIIELFKMKQISKPEVKNGVTRQTYSLSKEGFPSPKEILESCELDSLEDVPLAIRQLYRLKTWCLGDRGDVLVEVVTRENMHETNIVGLARPTRIFEGYGRVIIMSAYFKHSQMYHLLVNAHLDHQDEITSWKLVKYKTSRNFKDRADWVKHKSLDTIHMGALLSNTRTGLITSTMLSTGLIVKNNVAEKIKTLPKTLAKSDLISSAFAGVTPKGMTKNEREDMRETVAPPLLVLYKIAYEILQKEGVKNALCFTNSERGGSAAKQYRLQGQTVVPNVIEYLNLYGRLRNTGRYEKENRYVSKEVRESLEQSVDFFTIPSSTNVHGLNEWKHLHAFVHLAALNPKPFVANMLKRVMPEYEPEIDYAISNVIQTMYRTSLRDYKSYKKVVCLVLSEEIIEKVERVCFEGQKLKRVKTKSNYCELEYQSIDVVQKAEAGKKGGGRKRKYSDEDGVFINKEKARIRFGQKSGKDTRKEEARLMEFVKNAEARYKKET